jgi:nicotinamide mononucleotide transporter
MTDPLEIAATALTLVCVILAVKRSLWQFPTGILGTGLGFFVFWNSQFYSSAVLQPIFILIQIYGWWFWVRGSNSAPPPIRTTPPAIVIGGMLAALAIALIGGSALELWTDAAMAHADAAIFALSIFAQVLLSLKRIENWFVWIVINALSVVVYASGGKWLYAGLYAFFFFNAFWGWWEWRKELRSYSADPNTPARTTP